MTTELPQPDIRDQGGRARRLVLATIAGAAAASSAYGILWALATPDAQTNPTASVGAYKFVWYFTALAFGAVFLIVLAVATKRAKKKWMDEQVARAKVVT